MKNIINKIRQVYPVSDEALQAFKDAGPSIQVGQEALLPT